MSGEREPETTLPPEETERNAYYGTSRPEPLPDFLGSSAVFRECNAILHKLAEAEERQRRCAVLLEAVTSVTDRILSDLFSLTTTLDDLQGRVGVRKLNKIFLPLDAISRLSTTRPPKLGSDSLKFRLSNSMRPRRHSAGKEDGYYARRTRIRQSGGGNLA